MRILALDTTTRFGSVALLENTRLLAEANAESPTTHSAGLLRSIDDLLKKNSLEIREIDGFAAAAGPGSFTGIRIGLSTIKAFAFASQKQVAPVSGLLALAMKLQETQGRLYCPLIDAKKGEVFASLFEVQGRNLKAVIQEGAYGPDALLARLPAHRVIHFIGTGVETYKDKIQAYLGDKARLSSRSLFIGFEVGLIGYHLLKRGQGVGAEALEPLYYRKSQAEEKK
ncbi:MAG: tRNA (adenosine(37)-N6)-threonylcarbamoyltransferase complex dimerization subunit type 1 TsaB [Candidatus Aminicenantes bacterium]|nr:tRNA (adenosine(37)-N6)-threonylcarbamoyltransferase complex dimerization subunit type 1 TsaB [Candidatus Aminicenantes bacterium]